MDLWLRGGLLGNVDRDALRDKEGVAEGYLDKEVALDWEVAAEAAREAREDGLEVRADLCWEGGRDGAD